jgi:hypothetical protein
MSVSLTTEAERGRRSRSARRHLPAVAGHLGGAVDDDEELLADAALLDQDLAGGHRDGVE